MEIRNVSSQDTLIQNRMFVEYKEVLFSERLDMQVCASKIWIIKKGLLAGHGGCLASRSTAEG